MTKPALSVLAETIQHNLTIVRATIHEACRRVGRSADEIKLIAVTKMHPPEKILMAWQEGVEHFGENRVEESAGKIAAFSAMLPPESKSPIWHMIGHVQSRKADEVIRDFHFIHSLDSVKLAKRYDNFAREHEARRQVLVQVNISGESTKEGLLVNNWKHDPAQRHYLWTLIGEIAPLPHLEIVGLMTMAPYEAQPEQTRPVFAGLRELSHALAADFPHITWRELSMGMTNDYPVAIEEGATMVRIGRAIFGERL